MDVIEDATGYKVRNVQITCSEISDKHLRPYSYGHVFVYKLDCSTVRDDVIIRYFQKRHYGVKNSF